MSCSSRDPLSTEIAMDSSSSLQASKVRKPYTITKQRERWTEEEHMKFLEALKLYGRAWRRIEEHIGTKTAVQIRSHAQKFFSKLVKGSSGRGISSEKLEDIEIPPPRPKKKPRHPYPRKATASSVNSNSSQVSKEVNSLPSVVSSAPVLGDRPQQRAGFVPYNSKGRMPNHVNAQDGKLESSNTSNSSLFSLKLFGQTMLVSANEMPPTPSPMSASNASQGAFRKIAPQHQEEDSSKSDPEDAVLERSETVNSQGLNLLEKLIVDSAVDSGSGPSVGKICKRMDSSEEQVSSDMGTNSSCITRSQGSPSAVSSYPRHVPVQCVVDGNSTKNVSDNSKTWSNISPMPYSLTYNSGSLSNSEAISPWSGTIPALFPWVQMQNGENAVAEAVAAATAAAASAWWSLYGALPSFYPQTMFSAIRGMEPPMECRKSSPANIPETANNADPCNFTSKGCMSSTGKSSMKEADCENERSSNSSTTSSVDVAQDGFVVNAIVNKETGCPKRSHSNSAISMFEAEESTDLETETEESSMSRKRSRLNEAEVEEEHNSSLKSQVSDNENPKSASNKDLLEFGAQISNENSLSALEKFADNKIKQNSKKDSEGKNNAFCEDEVEAPETPSQKVRLCNFSRVNSIENSENKLSQGLVEAVAKSRSGLGFVPYQRCSVEAYKEAEVKNAEIMKDEN